MKVHQDNISSRSETLQYSKHPGDGVGNATIIEWSNGEGFDINLDGINLEVTNSELQAIVTLYALIQNNYFKRSI